MTEITVGTKIKTTRYYSDWWVVGGLVLSEHVWELVNKGRKWAITTKDRDFLY